MRVFLVTVMLLALYGPTKAEWFAFDDSVAYLRDSLIALDSTVATRGLVPTGSPQAGYGRRFYRHLFPSGSDYGYILYFVVSGDEYIHALRSHGRSDAVSLLRNRFETTKLFIITRSRKEVTVLAAPDSVQVTVPSALHECLQDTNRPYCCCCTDCKHECCEKGLGSTSVTATWTHPELDSMLIVYTYTPNPGGSQVYHRRMGSDKRMQIRWCADNVPARLK
jgi:hypothetical protein